MGFKQRDDEGFEYRYDFQAIYSNLLWRAKQMKKRKTQHIARFPEHFGQLLWQEGSDGGNIWLLFPSLKNTIYGALLDGQIGPYLRQGWYQGVIDPKELRDVAKDAMSREGWEELPLVLVDANLQKILFVRYEGEDGEEWTLAGVLEYGNPPEDKRQPVRWIRLSQPAPETLLALHGYRPSSSPSDVRQRCNRVLQEAIDWRGIVRDVSCLLTINLEKKVYRVELLEGSKPIARKETPYSDEVIRFLKYPQKTGEYFTTKDGTYLKWDPRKDVEYDKVTIKTKDRKREFYHLSMFKPLIHRSQFYPDSYVLPPTCEDFLQTKAGEDIILRIDVDEQRKGLRFKKYLRVQLDGLKQGGPISGLQYEDWGIYDVALLAECSQLVDIESNLRYDVSIDAESLVSLRLVDILSEYPRLQSAIIGHIEEIESAEVDEIETEADDEEVVPEDGPELRFVSVRIEESVRRRKLDVIVHLCNVDDETDFEELLLLSLSSEVAKMQSPSFGDIAREVRFNLRGRRVSSENRGEILREIEDALEKEGVRIDNY
jgi:hypothetical protein